MPASEERPALLDNLTAGELARLCGVDERTARRWKRDGMRDGPARRLLSVQQRNLGRWHPDWQDWWVDPLDGLLIGPDRSQWRPRDILAARLERQWLRELRRSNAELRAALDQNRPAPAEPAPVVPLESETTGAACSWPYGPQSG